MVAALSWLSVRVKTASERSVWPILTSRTHGIGGSPRIFLDNQPIIYIVDLLTSHTDGSVAFLFYLMGTEQYGAL